MLKEREWQVIEKLLPKMLGRPAKNNRNFFEAILWVAETGCSWRNLPRDKFGPKNTIYNRFYRWSKLGILDQIFAAIQKKNQLPFK